MQISIISLETPIIARTKLIILRNLIRGTEEFKSCKALLDRVENNDPKLVELVILPIKTFGDAELTRLANIISSGRNTNLKAISASGHNVSTSALALLGSALASQNGRNICNVAIGDENMNDEGVEAFCKALSDVNGGSLESVDFAFKNISKAGAEMIGRTFGASRSIKHIYLYRNPNIGDEGMAAFSLSAMNDDKSRLCFGSLEHLDISECDVGAAGAKALVECLVCGENDTSARSSLVDIQMSKNPLGAEGCLYLKDLISRKGGGGSIVQKLSIKKCAIGNDGLTFIVDAFKTSCKGFSSLDVTGNGISEDGALVLAQTLHAIPSNLQSLQELILADNSIGDESVLSIAKSLKDAEDEGNSSISVLDLSTTKCGISGAVALLKCSSLKSVRLFNNNLASEGFEAMTPLLVGGHPTLEHLDLGGNRAKESAVAALLGVIMIKNEPDENALRALELGGNEIGEVAEEILKELYEIRPELDVARDRPSVEQPNEIPRQELNME